MTKEGTWLCTARKKRRHSFGGKKSAMPLSNVTEKKPSFFAERGECERENYFSPSAEHRSNSHARRTASSRRETSYLASKGKERWQGGEGQSSKREGGDHPL